MRKNNGIIMTIVLVLVLGVGIAYAMLSDRITVNGTVSSDGSLDVEVVSAAATNSVGIEGDTVSVSADKNDVTIDVPRLLYPGATVTYTIELENVGTVNAMLKEITTEGVEDDGDLSISYAGIESDVSVLNANSGNSIPFTITITWNESSTTQFTGKEFSIVLDFEQSV